MYKTKTAIEWDRDNPLRRVDGESARQWRALQIYALLGTRRSFAKIAESAGASIQSMARWSVAYDWQARCERYDELQFAEMSKEIRAARRTIGALLLLRGREALERLDTTQKISLLAIAQSIRIAFELTQAEYGGAELAGQAIALSEVIVYLPSNESAPIAN